MHLRARKDRPRDGTSEQPAAPLCSRLTRRVWNAAAFLVVATVVGAFLRFHIPGRGFTYVLDFGDTLHLRHLPEISRLPVFFHKDVAGYDAQMYSQFALRPAAVDPDLRRAVDNPPYRARRVLMSWAAWLLGFGRAWWVLNAYAALNMLTWLALAWLLLRWFFPPTPDAFVRWCGVLLGAGMLASVRHALTDGPLLLAIAGMVAVAERGLRWPALFLGAACGLTRETGITSAAILVPDDARDWRGWLRAAGGGIVIVAPLLVWVWHVRTLGPEGFFSAGARNFSLPFLGFVERWQSLLLELGKPSWAQPIVLGSLATQVALTVQGGWIVLRPRWRDPWWRVGAAYVGLMATLGSAVWEGLPGAAPRVLLPLTLAFNVVVSRTRFGLMVLVLGNLGVVVGIWEMRGPSVARWSIVAAHEIEYDMVARRPALDFSFQRGFTPKLDAVAARFVADGARVHIENKHPFAVAAGLRALMRAPRPCRLTILVSGQPQWSGVVKEDWTKVTIPSLTLPPDGVDVEFRLAAEPGEAIRSDVWIAINRLELSVARVP